MYFLWGSSEDTPAGFSTKNGCTSPEWLVTFCVMDNVNAVTVLPFQFSKRQYIGDCGSVYDQSSYRLSVSVLVLVHWMPTHLYFVFT